MRSFSRFALLSALALAQPIVRPPSAAACATCRAGDPTLTPAAYSQPFAQRLRLGLDFTQQHSRIGDPGIEIYDRRMQLSTVFLAHERVGLQAGVPLVFRQVAYEGGGEFDSWHVGDANVRVQVLAFRDRRFAPQHLLWTHAGLTLPTAPELDQGVNRQPVPLERQTGTGSLTPSAGLAYAFLRAPWAVFAGGTFAQPVGGFGQSQPGRSFSATFALQYQPLTWLALRPSLLATAEGRAREYDGQDDPDSGGQLGAVGLAFVLRAHEDLLVTVSVEQPVLQSLRGEHTEGRVYSLGVLLDVGD